MDTLLAHCNLDSRACSRVDGAPLLQANGDGAVFCGHCGENLCPPGGHVTLMDITCKGVVVEWWSRELEAAVHRCGEHLVAESVESALRDLTSVSL